MTAESRQVMRPVVLLGPLLLFLVGFLTVSRGAVTLPYGKVFKGESEFQQLVQQAESENWRSLPLGERTVTVGKALLGTPYVNYTLEIDDHLESPSVNLRGVDCWTYFEISLGFARMLALKTGSYSPTDLLAMIELDRYRGGQCNGRYTTRLHYLEDWIYDNERRGLVTNLTRSLGGVPMRGRYLNEMSKYWRDSRYLRNNPGLVPEMRQIEDRISSRTIYHIPKREVPGIESKIQDGDVICISGNGPEGFTEHVGLASRDRAGIVHFMHASKDQRQVIVDVPLHSYLYRYSKFAGIMVVRPREAPQSALVAEASANVGAKEK
jgi:N-acetylmuramoyl-L-alanine amidase-like protein